ncbi:MAG: branched-chain amino acid transporter permease, partial [Rhizobacter sp.]|nr:branched-chain amino acid transporter permease [Rhizobacter sp.]
MTPTSTEPKVGMAPFDAPSSAPRPRLPRHPLKALAESFYGRRGAVWALVVTLVLLLLPATMSSTSYTLHLLFSVFVFALLGHAWNLMAGYAGLLSFGQQVFVGLGGFAQALLFYYAKVDIWVAWPISGIASLLFAWLLCLPLRESGSQRRMWIGVGVAVVLWLLYEWWIAVNPAVDVFQSGYVRRVALLLLIFLGALPLLRLQGAYFAIATWLIAESVSTVFNGWNVAGAGGGMQLKSEVSPLALYYVALVLLVVVTAIIWRWMRSSYGLALTAVRDDEEAARSSGVDVSRVKAGVFLFAAVVTGLASGLYFMDVVIITPPSAFAISWASYIVFVVVAGGMGTVAGPVIGAVLFIVVDRLLGAVAGQG